MFQNQGGAFCIPRTAIFQRRASFWVVLVTVWPFVIFNLRNAASNFSLLSPSVVRATWGISAAKLEKSARSKSNKLIIFWFRLCVFVISETTKNSFRFQIQLYFIACRIFTVPTLNQRSQQCIISLYCSFYPHFSPNIFVTEFWAWLVPCLYLFLRPPWDTWQIRKGIFSKISHRHTF